MNPRLAALYLRSRLAGAAAVVVAGVAALTWIAFARTANADVARLLLTIAPLGAAAVVGVSARSPFGETERTAPFPLPALRFGHLTGLVVWVGLTLAVAGTVEPTGDAIRTLVRNGAGYAGLALLGARLFGAGLSWLPAIGYGGAAYLAFIVQDEPARRWMWPVRPADDGFAIAAAFGLLLVGLVVVALTGTREHPSEPE